ncbi:MAG: hypothetical protein EBS55_09935 [Flavobacteriaceae bacterium]|nr:hypothetical protein [Flavobacteriaceae bacterium]
MKNLFIINEEEKNRILNLHETATKRLYLNEQQLDLGQETTISDEPKTLVDSGAIVKQGIGSDPYTYAKLGNNYYYTTDTNTDNPNWILATKPKAINAIKNKIFDESLPETKSVTPPNKKTTKVRPVKTTPKKVDTKTNKISSKKPIDNRKIQRPNKTNVVLSKSMSPEFKTIINTEKIDANKSVPLFKYEKPDCAQFVNDFDESRSFVGNAWNSHDLDSSGQRVWSSFEKINSEDSKKVVDLWKRMYKSGGGKDEGPFTLKVKSLVNTLVPSNPPVSLKLNDVVGIFYPGSKHHEKAFYDAGKPYFVNGKEGKTIQSGKGWGMNTHLGIVGAIKDGVPIVFHNIGGQVFADPYNNLKGGSKIAWVKRA